jgi:hypothetical protein
MPTARSLAPLPANAPQPPRAFSPYLPPTPRDHDQWGKPEPFERLPRSFEVPGMLQQLGGYFSQHGAYASAPLGAGLFANSKEYNDAFMKGQDWKMKMAKEQFTLHSEQLEEVERARSVDYADVFIRHQAEGNNDPSAMLDDLWSVAVKSGDNDISRMIENGDSAETIRRYLAGHEAHIRALGAANKKSKEQSDNDGLYGLPEGGGAEAGGGAGDKPYDPYTNPGGKLSGAPPAAPATPAAAPGKVAGPGAPSGEPDDDAIPGVFKGLKLDPAFVGAATAAHRGEGTTGMGKGDAAQAVKYGHMLDEETAKILADPNIKPGEVMDAVRKRLGPQDAAAMKNMENYDIPPGSTSGYGKQGDWLRNIENLILKDKPHDAAHGQKGWVADYYADRHSFRTSPVKSTILLRTKDMANQMDNINNDLTVVQKELAARGVKATDIHLEDAVKLLGGSESMNRLMSDLGSYSTAYNVVVSGGHSTLGGTEAVNQFFKPYFPLSTIRNVIKGHVPSAQGILQGLHNEWESIGGKPDDMPRGDASVERRIEDNGLMDTVTGARPYREVVNHNGVPAMWTGKNQFDRNAPENWVDPKSTRD